MLNALSQIIREEQFLILAFRISLFKGLLTLPRVIYEMIKSTQTHLQMQVHSATKGDDNVSPHLPKPLYKVRA